MLALKAQKRQTAGKYAAFNLRKKGYIPAVIYGKSEENMNIQILLDDFEEVIHSGERILDLEIDGEKKNVVLKSIQHGTFDWQILHADFRILGADSKVHLSVEIQLTGDAAGVEVGGVVEHLLHEVEVECSPNDLPEHITVDVTSLELGGVWYVSGLPTIAGVSYTTTENVAVVSCHLPAGEEDSAADDATEEPEEAEASE